MFAWVRGPWPEFWKRNYLMSDLSPWLMELDDVHFPELNHSSQGHDDSWKWPGDPVTSPVLHKRWGGRGSRATGELKTEPVTGATGYTLLQGTGSQKREGWDAGSFPLRAHWLCKVMARLPWFPVRRAACCPASTNAQWLGSWGAALQLSRAVCSQV